MGLIRFLKPDLKRIIFLLIILSPFIIINLPLPPQFHLWDSYIYKWGNAITFPFILAIIILFGGFDTGGGLFPYTNFSGIAIYSMISDIVIYLIGILFWYVISCAIATGWHLLFKSVGKNSKRYEKATIISLITVFAVIVIILPTIATLCIDTEKITRQNISMNELVSGFDPVKLQEIRIKNNFIFPAAYRLPDITACLYDKEGNLKLGYSVTYKAEDGSFIEDIGDSFIVDVNPSGHNVVIVPPNTETKIYLSKFIGVNNLDNTDYEIYDQVLLLTNVGMDNSNCCYSATDEDIFHSEKIQILK